MPSSVFTVPAIEYSQRRRTAGIPGALFLLAKPGIVLAETAAGFAGIILAGSGRLPPSAPLCRTLLILILAASGAAMANCLLDAAADQQMARLAARSRALATVGRRGALAVALLLMGGAFLLAHLYLNGLALLLLAAACSSYLFLYTLWLKRTSPWGVLAGAIPGALPPLIGAAAVSGTVAALPLLLSGFIFIWQFPHFCFLALHCQEEYRRAGIPVLPLVHGEATTRALALAATLPLLPVSIFIGQRGGLSGACLAAACLAGLIFPLYAACCLYRSKAYRQGFIASTVYLLILIAALCAESLLGAISFNNW